MEPQKLAISIILIVLCTLLAAIGGTTAGAVEGAAKAAADSAPAKKVNTNRLIHESSPYLLQHANNPVDWYPWGPEAFEKAKREDKPVFLSIGYSTCHWCHVMEHESFEDDEVAGLLNRYFVAVKVDREERPDIDKVYMTVTQAMTGSGGWPMTVILTPEKKPFLAGTYFPKTARWGKPGLMELLPKIADVWKNNRQDVLDSADKISRAVADLSVYQPGDGLTAAVLLQAQTQLAEQYDAQNGGFGSKPKFPTPHILSFLLRQYYHGGDKQALAMVENTLTQIRLGGIFDHLGFGFHRYSTDERWLVPHFEKMLYDQAMLAIAYTEAGQVTGNVVYERTVREIFTYILRDMTNAEGGFYSAEDADSEGVEGKFYLWHLSEVNRIIDPATAALFRSIFNLAADGNFSDPGPGHSLGDNILYLKKPIPELAEELNLPVEKIQQQIERGRKQLFTARQRRVHPFKDDKVLTDWNGLMIAALAKAGRVFNEPRYTAAAEKAAAFIITNLRDLNGRLLKRYRQGHAGLPGFLDDYAFVIWGFLELYEATFDGNYLKKAIELNEQMLHDFWDNQNGGLFMAAHDSEKLLIRKKEIYDGAIPSGNSVAALNLLRLGHMTGKQDYLARAESIVKTFSTSVKNYPAGHAQLLVALNFALHPNFEVVIVGEPKGQDTIAMLSALQKTFLPEKVVLLRPADQKAASQIIALAPFTRSMTAKNGKATAYVCRGFACNLPTTDIAEMLKHLEVTP